MKRLFTVKMMLAIILIVAMVSCKKDSASDNNGGNGGGGTNGHEYVDLGLPSGNLWATSNLSDSTINGYLYGYLYDFAWGETAAKEDCYQSNYKFYIGTVSDSVESCIPPDHPAYYSFDHPYIHFNRTVYSKYNENLNITYEHPILDASDDAATVNWGDGWRIPTIMDWWELFRNCTITPTTSGPNKGLVFTSLNNNNTLFLPTDYYDFNSYITYYWTNSVEENIHQMQWDDDDYCYLYTDYDIMCYKFTMNTYLNTIYSEVIERPRYEHALIRPVFSNH